MYGFKIVVGKREPKTFKLLTVGLILLGSTGKAYGGCSSVGRAPGCGLGCRGFESLQLPLRKSAAPPAASPIETYSQ